VPPRFYVPAARAQTDAIELPTDEAAHLSRVLRLSAGDRVRVFNGRGEEWDAVVSETTRTRVLVQLETRIESAKEAGVAITLAVSVLKGDKMDDLVRDAVMLGVVAIQPLVTARTETTLATIERSGRVARWQRVAVSSAKQCGRAVVPEIRPALRFEDAMKAVQTPVMLVEPAAAAPARTLHDLPSLDALTLVAGPEGGWSEDEVRLGTASGAMLLTLGAQTLRADAVPIVAITAVRVRLEDF
jgi:16S rRNA (uracil1498-N3)-methyltransferase